jgi:hypothetical protein
VQSTRYWHPKSNNERSHSMTIDIVYCLTGVGRAKAIDDVIGYVVSMIDLCFALFMFVCVCHGCLDINTYAQSDIDYVRNYRRNKRMNGNEYDARFFTLFDDRSICISIVDRRCTTTMNYARNVSNCGKN